MIARTARCFFPSDFRCENAISVTVLSHEHGETDPDNSRK